MPYEDQASTSADVFSIVVNSTKHPQAQDV